MPKVPAQTIVKSVKISSIHDHGPVLDWLGSAEFGDGLHCCFQYSIPSRSGVIATGSHGAASLVMFRRTSAGKQAARMANETPRWWALLRHLGQITQ
jgi:hypothetical protein